VNAKTGLVILLLLGLGPYVTTHGQRLPSDDEIVRQLDDEMRLAVLNDDWSALERLLSEQFTVNAPTNRLVSGRSAVLELIRQAPRESFERTVEYIRVDGDFGIIMGAVSPRRRFGRSPTLRWPVRRCGDASQTSGGRKRGRGAWLPVTPA
jgi:hypothetical protein